MSSSPELRGTDSFIWCTKHAIGVGATSTVFVGRFKKTGDQVAIKVFNNQSYDRPRDVQIRELEVVRKLKHKNIVEVLAIEEDHVSKQPVIIMEFCRGGSLLQYLEEPENLFGLREKEFLTALKHILDGMKYLRKSGVVHRDIKPGNIMRVKCEDGSNTYKLADFGAARQIADEDESLQSLCGTEEYLRADLYGIAVLRVGGGANYTKTVDLWSLGVTLYQLATGQLPFRPYGGRRNRETMHYLITRKESGVISGVQHDSPTGRIEWFNELPINCHLSRGLKPLVTYMLARLLESAHDNIWTFNDLFKYTDNLTTMKRVDIFNTRTTEALSVYVTPTANYVELLAKIKEQSKIEPKNQLLCWQNTEVIIKENLKCQELPQTHTDRPLFLYSTENNNESFGIITLETPDLPNITSAYNLDNDALIAKMGHACLSFYLGVLIHIRVGQQHISSAANTFWNIYQERIRNVQYKRSTLQQLQIEVEIKLDTLSHRIRLCVLRTIPDDIPGNSSIKNDKQKLETTTENLNILKLGYKQLQRGTTDMYNKLHSLAKHTFINNFEELMCNGDDKCVERLEVLVENVGEIYDQFKNDKREKRLKYNEEQIHKMDKQKLRCKCVQGASLLRDHCEPKLQSLHNHFDSWYKNVNSSMQSLLCLETDMETIRIKFNYIIKSLNQVEDELQNVLMSSTNYVSTMFKTCVTMAEGLKVSQDEIRRSKDEIRRSQDEIKTLHKQLSDAKVEKEIRVVEKTVTPSPESLSPRRIRVPKHIKEQFLSMGNDLEKTKKDISDSSRILEEMRLQEDHLKNAIY